MNVNVLKLAMAGLAVMALSGCAVNPLTLEVGERDKEVYTIKDEGVEHVKNMGKRERKTLSILVDCHSLKDQGVKGEDIAYYRDSLATYLNGKVGSISYFKVVPTDSALENLTVQAFKNQFLSSSELKEDESDTVAKPNLADYTLIANVTQASAQGMDSFGATAPTVEATLSLELYDNIAHEGLLNRAIHREVNNAKSTKSGFGTCFALCAQEYVQLLADEFGAGGRVLKTVGNGRCARINLGEEAGLKAGSRIQFMKFVEKDEVLDEEEIGGMKNMEAVAFGKVNGTIPVEKNAAWVDIDDYKTVKVLKGMPVKIVHEEQKNLNRFQRFVKRIEGKQE